jgi:hypothetical protein
MYLLAVQNMLYKDHMLEAKIFVYNNYYMYPTWADMCFQE